MSTLSERHYEEEVKKNTRLNIKPSTELIPDEYHVNFDGTECVHIFVANPDLVVKCEKLLETLNIKVPECNIHYMENSDDVLKILKEVAINCDETSLLLMLFWGYSTGDGEFKLDDDTSLPFYRIWSSFLSSKCSSFRDKPKVFLFNVIKSHTTYELDSAHYVEPSSPFEVPNEADLLIVYKHNKDKNESSLFIEELADTLTTYGQLEDFCTLVSITNPAALTKPILISTMLKKLFMIPSKLRGHYLSFEIKHNIALTELKKANNILAEKEKSCSRNHSSSDHSVSKTPHSSEIANQNYAGTAAKNSKDSSLHTSTDRLAPRISVERSPRRPSTSETPVKKISRDEKKRPWR